MATTAEALRVEAPTKEIGTRRTRPRPLKAVADWFRRGQLGAPSSIEIARYTGSRV